MDCTQCEHPIVGQGNRVLIDIFLGVLTCHDPSGAVGHGRTTQNNYSRFSLTWTTHGWNGPCSAICGADQAGGRSFSRVHIELFGKSKIAPRYPIPTPSAMCSPAWTQCSCSASYPGPTIADAG